MPKPTPTEKQVRVGAYTTCRTLGHSWEGVNTTSGNGLTIMELRCVRCTMDRFDHVDDFGELARRQYRRPLDYGLSEKMSRAQWRVRFLSEILR